MVGDIVLVPFPFTDLGQAKLRPAVLVADVRYPGQADWMVCQITTQSHPGSRQIAVSGQDLAAGGLRDDSWARPDRLMTLNENIFGRTIGRLNDPKLGEVLSAVRSLF